MKRKKKLIVLAGVLAALCLILVVEYFANRHIDKINTTDEEVLAVDQEELTEVSWEYQDKNLKFIKKDETWYSEHDDKFPVDQEKMENFLDNFSSVHAAFIIDDVEDYDQYGLKSPQAVVTLKTKKKEITVKIGNYSSMDEQRYITVDDKKVYLINTDLLEVMTAERTDFMKQDQLGGFDQLESFTVTGDNSLNLVYDEESHTYTDAYSWYLVSGKKYKPLSTSFTETFTDQITNMELTDYVTYTAGDDDLKKYGLDQPLMTVEVAGIVDKEEEKQDDETEAESEKQNGDGEDETDSSESYTLLIGKKGMGYYANVKGSSIIYKFDSETYDTLKETKYNDLRPQEVFSLDWDKVSGMSFAFSGKEYTVDVINKKSGNTYKIDGKKVDFDQVEEAVDALTIHEFREEKAEKEEEFSMTIKVENEDSDKPTELNLVIYQQDGDDCLAYLDGECLGLMDRSLMVDLREAVQTAVLNQG